MIACPICGDEFPGEKSGSEHCLPCDLRAMRGERIEYGDGRHPGLREPDDLGPAATGFDRHQLQLMPRREPCRASFECRCPWHTGPNPVGQNMRALAHVPWAWCEECAAQTRWELWQRDAFSMRTPRPMRIRYLRAMGYAQADVAKIIGVAQQRVSEVEKNFPTTTSATLAG